MIARRLPRSLPAAQVLNRVAQCGNRNLASQHPHATKWLRINPQSGIRNLSTRRQQTTPLTQWAQTRPRPWRAPAPSAVRVLTTRELPKPRSGLARFAMRTMFYVGIFVSGTVLFVVGFFAYDASTYRESPSTETLPVSSLALTPRRFGPKNLPVVEHFVDDDHSAAAAAAKHRPRIVILGTGWGAVSLIKSLKAEDYHVTVISPSNQFLFTPMLPSASTGTLELRSLVEPVRKIICRIHGHFLKAMAVDVCFSEKLVEVEAKDSRGQPVQFYVPYDKLVIACGGCS
jgi:NADH dehydrogenase